MAFYLIYVSFLQTVLIRRLFLHSGRTWADARDVSATRYRKKIIYRLHSRQCFSINVLRVNLRNSLSNSAIVTRKNCFARRNSLENENEKGDWFMGLAILRASDTNELARKLIRDIVVLNKRVNGPLKSCSIKQNKKKKKYKKKLLIYVIYLAILIFMLHIFPAN